MERPADGNRPIPFALIGAVGFGAAVALGRQTALAGLLLGVPAAAVALGKRQFFAGTLLRRLSLSLGPLLFAATWLTRPLVAPFPEPSWMHLVGGLLWLAPGMLLLRFGDGLPAVARRWIVGMAISVAALFGAVLIAGAADIGIDVTHIQMVAGTALAEGESPYSQEVAVPDWSPLASPGDEIVGYPYPPAALGPFALAEILLDDHRWTSLAAWLVFLVILGRWALRCAEDATPLAALIVMAALPGWPRVLLASWTEPLSLVLLAGGLAMWRRSTRGSSLLFGVGLASKQYLWVLWPIVLVWEVVARWRRATWVTVGAAVALMPVLVWGVEDAFRSLVQFHLTRPPRSDGSSLVGLLDLAGVGWIPPPWLAVVVTLVVITGVGRRVRDPVALAIVLALTLTAIFLVSSQAFMNYWLLPAGLMATAAAQGSVWRAETKKSGP